MHRVGLTLIELLLVLAMLAIAAGLTLPNFVGQAGDGARLRTHVARLEDQFRRARQLAIDNATTICISVSVNDRRLRIFDQHTPQISSEFVLSPELAVRVVPAPTQIRSSTSLVGDESSSANILFRADGSATPAHIEVSAGSSGWLLSIERLTGQVSLGELP